MNESSKPKQPTPPVAKPKSKKAPAPFQATGTAIRATSDNNKPSAQFSYVFGPQEQSLHDWMACVFDPENKSARVPNATGGFELYTQLWRTKDTGTAVADSAGNLFIGVCASGWTESGNQNGVPASSCTVLGYTTPGKATLASTGAVAIATSPAAGSTQSVVGVTGQALVQPTQLNPNTRIRLVAAVLKVHSVLAANTAKGEIMVCGSVNPGGEVQGGAVNSSTFNDIKNTNSDVMSRAIRAIPSWKSGEVLSIVAIPAEQQSFEMVQLPATGTGVSDVPLFHMGCFGRNFTAGDSVVYDVIYVWETEMGKTYETDEDRTAVVPVSPDVLDIAKNKMRPYAALMNHPSAPDNIHALPWIETLATTQPAAVHALASHPVMKPIGHKLPAAGPVIVQPAKAPEESFLGKVLGAGKTLLNSVAQGGYLKNVPVVGNILDTVAKGISSIFG